MSLPLRIPTTAPLRDTYLLPSTAPSLLKSLSRLSRPSLITLVLTWLEDKNLSRSSLRLNNFPNASDDDGQGAYETANSVDELRDIYEEFAATKGGKREVIDRILEWDWRGGVSLWQLATLDLRVLEENLNGAMRWTALELVRVMANEKENGNAGSGSATNEEEESEEKLIRSKALSIPHINPSTFIQNLHSAVAPLVKAHYHIHRLDQTASTLSTPITILRIFITDSPYQAPQLPTSATTAATKSYTDGSRTLYIALPDSTPYIYISTTSSSASAAGAPKPSTDTRTLKRVVLEAIPKAFSRPHERYGVQVSHLSARSLGAMLAFRGAVGGGEGKTAAGAYSGFAEGAIEGNLLENEGARVKTTRKTEEEKRETEEKENEDPTQAVRAKRARLTDSKRPGGLQSADEEEKASKKRKIITAKRFGTSAQNPEDGKGLDRLEVKLLDHIHGAKIRNQETADQSSNPRRAPPSNALLQSEYIGTGNAEITSTSTLTSAANAEATETSQTATGLPLNVGLTFSGTHVFAGLRMLAERGVLDAESMPSWATGEEGVSVMSVKGGSVIGRGGA